MKTFDKKDVYSWSNAEEAKTYIGKTVYFNNDFESIKRAIELGDPDFFIKLEKKFKDLRQRIVFEEIKE